MSGFDPLRTSRSRDQAVSYWLMPCPQAQLRFEALSQQAGRGLHGSTLPLHITLYSDRLDHEDKIIDCLSQVAMGRGPILLTPSAIEAGSLFTTSLIVRFAASGELKSWFTQLRERSLKQLDYQLNPHLSLIYSSEPDSCRQAVAEELPLPAPALFNRVRAVMHPLTISTAADIRACTSLQEFTLT